MLMKKVTGVLHVLTALVTGFWAIYLIGLPSIGGPWSWWYPINLAASILLLVGGLHIAAPQLKHLWLLAVAFGLSLLCWNLAVWFREGLIFAGASALATWCALALSSFWKRGWIVSLVATLLLATWWIPQSVRTFAAFFSARASLAPSGLLWAIAPSVLVIASLIAVGIVSRRSLSTGDHAYDAPR
jgi:hypothetical protein